MSHGLRPTEDSWPPKAISAYGACEAPYWALWGKAPTHQSTPPQPGEPHQPQTHTRTNYLRPKVLVDYLGNDGQSDGRVSGTVLNIFFFFMYRSYTNWQIRMLGDLVKTDCQISNPLLTIDAKMTGDNYVFIENIFHKSTNWQIIVTFHRNQIFTTFIYNNFD